MNCPSCQSENPEVAKFCMNCGASLTDVTASVNAGEKSSFNLDRYLPHELVTKLEAARSRDAMVGERRVITMLFCDVKGSTAAAEKVDPEIWTDIMNGVFEFMIRPIYKYEGLVSRLMGDAILAFFGAPITHEDDPQRAVLAGLEIQEGIKSYVDEIRLNHGLEFGLRVGINTGLVVVGEIGSDLRMEYTAIGDAINLAARMEQTAQVGTIQISDETYKLVAPFFIVESLGEVEVKGKSAPINTYRVLGVRSTPGQLRGLDGLSSPLVGREDQLALLTDRLKDLSEGIGSVVALVGEAGLGKSTLIAALKKSDSSFTWLRGDSFSYTRSISYHPWRQIIRQSVEANEDDTPAEVREKLNHISSDDVPFLEAMLAVEGKESTKIVAGFQGDALKQRMIDATRGFMRGLSVESPLVIVFDDLHWSDEASLNLLLNVVDLNAEQPILFICMSRPEKDAASWDSLQMMSEKLGHDFHSIELAPLQLAQTETLLNNLLGANELPKAIRELITSKGEGNPFFVEEIIRSLIETKQIVREDGHWKGMGDEAKITLPNTLRGVLSARIDRLPEASKQVLQDAAVIGRLFDLRILKRLTGLNGGLDSHIQYLTGASLIEAMPEEYAFRHGLIQEATYESILIKKRAELHRQIGETMEELYAGRIEEFAPLLAYHFYTAGDERSLKYDFIAGENSARLYANAEAITHFSRALEVAKRGHNENVQLTDIFVQLGQSQELSGHYDQALATYHDMQASSLERGDRSRELKSLIARATIYSTLNPAHNPSLGESIQKQALALANELGDISSQAKLHWNLMLNYLFSNRLPEALQHCEPTVELARQVNDLEQLAFTLNDAGRVYQGTGAFEKAFAAFEEARTLWKAQDNQVMLADNLSASAITNFFAGNFDQALLLSDQAWEISKKTDNYWGQSYSRVASAYIHLERGFPDLAIHAATESIRVGELGGLFASTIAMRASLGWFYGYYGATEEGLAMTDLAIKIADENQSDWKTLPLATKVRLYLLNGDVKGAESVADSQTLQPITIPYARFTVMIGLANIELALGQMNYSRALWLSEDLLEKVLPQTRVDIHEVMHRKADALIGLGQLDEALQTLTEACSIAEKLDAKHYLWIILSSLANVSDKLGKHQEADACLKQARNTVSFIAERLEKIELKDSFLDQPRLQKLMRD